MRCLLKETRTNKVLEDRVKWLEKVVEHSSQQIPLLNTEAYENQNVSGTKVKTKLDAAVPLLKSEELTDLHFEKDAREVASTTSTVCKGKGLPNHHASSSGSEISDKIVRVYSSGIESEDIHLQSDIIEKAIAPVEAAQSLFATSDEHLNESWKLEWEKKMMDEEYPVSGALTMEEGREEEAEQQATLFQLLLKMPEDFSVSPPATLCFGCLSFAL
ncbi:hypothetical protein CANMA_002368 [Candida margitis]|uniref:uncharacterized protein n=1 Tax=Candida margitis TaxID=1775924 RepID=UPI0022273459|nr:uncharacterized protein CANMA_002368 [Candida margitis]KAI5968377.1 hypothetical protein CANMA_002368 [Candida margitis]